MHDETIRHWAREDLDRFVEGHRAEVPISSADPPEPVPSPAAFRTTPGRAVGAACRSPDAARSGRRESARSRACCMPGRPTRSPPDHDAHVPHSAARRLTRDTRC